VHVFLSQSELNESFEENAQLIDDEEWPAAAVQENEDDFPVDQMPAENDAFAVEAPVVGHIGDGIHLGQPASPDAENPEQEIDATYAEVPYVLHELNPDQIHHICYQEFAISSPPPTPYDGDCFSPTYSTHGPVSPPGSPVFQPSPPQHVANPVHPCCPCNTHHSNPDDEFPTLDEVEHEMMKEGLLPFDFHTNFRKYCF